MKPCVACGQSREAGSWICESCRGKPVVRQCNPALANVERGDLCAGCWQAIPVTHPAAYRSFPSFWPCALAGECYVYRLCDECEEEFLSDRAGRVALKMRLQVLLPVAGHA